MWYDKHEEGCVVWETPIDEGFDCTCRGMRRQNSVPPDYVKPDDNAWVDQVEFGLANNFSTQEILADIGGVKFDSLMERCRRNMYDNLKSRMQALKREEDERARAALR